MRALIVAVLLIVAVTARTSRNDFDLWRSRFNKEYQNNEEVDYRYQVWKDNVRYIDRYNAQNGPVTLGVNKFADMTNEEFRATYLRPMHRVSRTNSTRVVSPSSANGLPIAVDWTQKGAVTPVEDQGSCGSCWAFSTVAAIESAHFIATHQPLTPLSQQQLIDCCDTCQGCDGGFMPDAFQCVIDAGGLDKESCYPYETAQRSCRFQTGCVGATISSYAEVLEGSEADLAAAVANQPVSIGIDASHVSFQFYQSGIYDDTACSSTDIDHAVFLVGYNDASAHYWIIRNSWGTDWGQEGYVWIRKDKGNRCGVATAASYPVV